MDPPKAMTCHHKGTKRRAPKRLSQRSIDRLKFEAVLYQFWFRCVFVSKEVRIRPDQRRCFDQKGRSVFRRAKAEGPLPAIHVADGNFVANLRGMYDKPSNDVVYDKPPNDLKMVTGTA